jgi:excisionase family DNA binding protein
MVCGKPERLMTVAEVADLLGVTGEEVLGWIRAGDLRVLKTAGHADARVRQVDLEKFLRARELTEQSSQPAFSLDTQQGAC